jgi:hypothetical protein
MSESAPESSGGGGVKGAIGRKVGPLPLWAWLGLVTLVAVGYYMYKKNQAGNSTANQSTAGTGGTAGTTDQSLVPQFVNQTYVENNPPSAPATNTTTPPVKPPVKKPQTVQHKWTAIAADSTLDQVAGRLGLFEPGKNTPDVADLTPENATAKNWLKNVYPKNHNAKIPKGATFTYDLGTVVNK